MRKQKSTKQLLIKQMKKMHAAHSMVPDWKTASIVVMCIIVDTFFLYDITSALFGVSPAMVLIVAIMIAFGIDGIPVVIAGIIQEKDRDKYKNGLIILCLIVFVLLIIGIFVLRLTTMEEVFKSPGYTSSGTGSNSSGSSDPFNATEAQICISIIMSIIPLSTSLITFTAATHKSLAQKKMEIYQKSYLILTERKQELEVKIVETKREQERNLDDLEEKRYEVMVDRQKAVQEVLERQAKTELAMKLQTADAANELLEK